MTPLLRSMVALTLVCAVIGLFSLATAQDPKSPVEDKIRAALEGEASADGTGDVVLDDVLGLIQQRGSILDGSSLDPDKDGEGAAADRNRNRKAYAAEQLLKASRLLDAVSAPADQSLAQHRADLVKRMRAEAVKLLSE